MAVETDKLFPKEGLVRAQADGLELRDGSDDQAPVLAGHFAVFNEWTEVDSIWEGHFLERIAPGAFTKTIDESSERMRVLFNHGQDALGNQSMGKIRSLTETTHGAAYEVELFDGIPPLILNGLRAGEYGSSFRFSVVKEEMERKPKASEHNPDALPERIIQEARVMEFGPVTFPAYPTADAGIRSLTDKFMLPDAVLERLADRAAALPPEEPEPSATTPEVASRSTHRDYLKQGEEAPSWRL